MSEQVPQGSLSSRVAEEIRVALARQRKTQRSLADDLGVSAMWVSTRLSGVQEIGLNDVERIARALNISVAHLIPVAVLSHDVVAGAA